MDIAFNNHQLNILDFPDEILLIIVKNLNTIDILSSLLGVNQRFDRLIVDPLHIRHVDMTNGIIENSLSHPVSFADARILSKFCQSLLPRIHHHLEQLTLAQYSIESILQTIDYYPQLHSLSLRYFHEDALYQHLTDNRILRDLLCTQITHLFIDGTQTTESSSESFGKILAILLALCGRLTVLDFGDVLLTRKCWVFLFPREPTDYISSTLVKLKINVASFDDCLVLMDGRLESLSTFIVNVSTISKQIINVDRSRKLPRLKYLSFTSFGSTFYYDDLIVPLLCRMTNLEELYLFFSPMRCNSTYVDGIQLYDQFLRHMTQLRKFAFNIRAVVFNNNAAIELPSNEDIQRSFVGRIHGHVASHIDTTSTKIHKECHIYSLPYAFDYFVDLTNSFQGDIFEKVRYLKMNDGNSFEFDFFQVVSQSFPALKSLSISNSHPQKGKKHSSTSIAFPHLSALDLTESHVDYAEQFLLIRNAYVPRLMHLCIRYRSIVSITNNFTNDVAGFNFTAVKSVGGCEPFVRPQRFSLYFPLA